MSLRSKIVWILIAVVGIYAATTDQIQRAIFYDEFERVEEQEAREDLERVIEALHSEIDEVDRLSLEWSAWDDAYAYVQGKRKVPFEQSNLSEDYLRRQGIDLLFFLGEPDRNGGHKVLWSTISDPDTADAVRLRDFPTGTIHSTHPLLVKHEWNEVVQRRELAEAVERGETTVAEGERRRRRRQTNRPVGILLTEHRPLLVSARPIVDSQRTHEPVGTLVLGRFLSNRVDDEITKLTRVDFDFWQADGRHELPTDVQSVLREASSQPDPVLRESEEHLAVYGVFPDFRNLPQILLRANVTRDISATGKTAVRFGFVSAVAGGFILLSALMYLLQRIVLSPLSTLTEHAVSIGKREDFRAKLGLERGDEIGTLSNEFDDMMEKLERARAALVDTARTAGMSEIATGILHNVGNVLNSVNISAGLVSQKVEGMSVTDLTKVVEILEAHKDDLGAFIEHDPKGKHLQPFLTALAGQLGEEQKTIAEEIGSLSEGIDHICELIKSQQSYAIQAELVEQVSLAEKMDEALRITDQAITVDGSLEVIREYEELPDVLIDKHKLLETLVNLIQNARQAMDERGGDKRLTMRAKRQGDDGVHLEIEDNGVGIPEDSLAKVFNLGFTTKSEGHGYGLHTAANATTEMGGSLTAHSDGPGRGATFVLALPLSVPATTGEEQ